MRGCGFVRLSFALAVSVAMLFATTSEVRGAGTPVNLVQGSAGMVWMPILVGREMKYFEAEGLDVNYIITGGGAKAAQALVTGSADFAATTLTDTINARRQGADVRVLAALLRQYPTDCVIRNDAAKRARISAKSPIGDRIQALKNLKIGLGGQGGPGDQLIIWLARRAHFDPNRDVQRIFLGTDVAVLSALQNGAIDVFCYGPPTSTRAVLSGDALFLFHIVGGNDLPEISHFPNAVLVTTQRFAQKRPDVVGRMARAYVEAIAFMQKEPDKVSGVIKPLFANMDAATFEASFDSAKAGFPRTPVLQAKDVQAVIDFARGTTGEPISITASDLLDNSWVTKALQELLPHK
jgi:NitT/TauT family transport system substrate-binding protein